MERVSKKWRLVIIGNKDFPEVYEKFHFTKKYLKQKTEKIPNYKKLHREINLVEKFGYKNPELFKKHVEEWNNLARKIPTYYLELIGADKKTLELTLDLDMSAFNHALEKPFYFDHFFQQENGVFEKALLISLVIKHPSGGSVRQRINEEKAVEMMQGKCFMESSHGYLEIPSLKIVWVTPDGKLYEVFNSPKVVFTENFMTPHNFFEGRTSKSKIRLD